MEALDVAVVEDASDADVEESVELAMDDVFVAVAAAVGERLSAEPSRSPISPTPPRASPTTLPRSCLSPNLRGASRGFSCFFLKARDLRWWAGVERFS